LHPGRAEDGVDTAGGSAAIVSDNVTRINEFDGALQTRLR